MEGRIRIFLLRAALVVLSMVVISGCAGNQSVDTGVNESEAVIQPEVERRDIKPARIDTEDFEDAVYALEDIVNGSEDNSSEEFTVVLDELVDQIRAYYDETGEISAMVNRIITCNPYYVADRYLSGVAGVSLGIGQAVIIKYRNG